MMKRFAWYTVIVLLLIVAGLLWLDHKVSAPNSPKDTVPSHHISQTTPKPESAGFNKNQYSTTDPSSIWVIVNKQHPLNPKDYVPADLTPVGNGQLMRSDAAAQLGVMLAAAKAAGYTVSPGSGYRSYETQVAVYNSEVKAYGQAQADSESARPGFSEHQTGLAIDLASGGCSITDCFGNTPGGAWIIANAYKYGFIQRYPVDKVSVTGYRDETWHFRYVGIPLSTQLHDQHIETLEEFFDVSGGTNY